MGSYERPVLYVHGNHARATSVEPASEPRDLRRLLLAIETMRHSATKRDVSPDAAFGSTSNYYMGICAVNVESPQEILPAMTLSQRAATELGIGLRATDFFAVAPSVGKQIVRNTVALTYNKAQGNSQDTAAPDGEDLQLMTTVTKLFHDEGVGLYAVVGNVGTNQSYCYHNGQLRPIAPAPSRADNVPDGILSVHGFPVQPGDIIVHATRRSKAAITPATFENVLHEYPTHRNLNISLRQLLWSVDARSAESGPRPIFNNDIALSLMRVDDTVPAYA